MPVSESQIKGLIAVCLTLVIIPFFGLFFSSVISYRMPVFADQCSDCLAIEIVDGDHSAGVYFVVSGTTANQLLKSVGIGQPLKNNFQLRNGMKLIINSASGKQGVVVAKMAAAERLALNMPLDINQVTEDDLLLIMGIGLATAQKILDLRRKINRFRDINQLMEIKGIKEKKLAQIRKYLYVEQRLE